MNLLHVLTICSAWLENLLFSGIIYGWPSLQYVLLEEGYFLDLCNTTTNPKNSSVSFDDVKTNHSHFISCQSRDETLNLAFTLGASSPFLISLISGIVLDKYGTWFYRSFATTMFSVSFILLAITSTKSSWIIFPTSMMIGIAGSTLTISNIQVANLGGPFKGAVMSSLNGAFLAAAIVFMLVKVAYTAGMRFQKIFLILALLSGLTWIRTFLLMPRKLIKLHKPSSLKFGWKEWSCFNKSQSSTKMTKQSSSLEMNDVPMLLHADTDSSRHKVSIAPKKMNKSFKSSVCSVMFWTNMLHFCVGHVRLTFYYGSFVNWIENFEDVHEISNIINVFGMTLLLGVLASPICGLIFDGITKWRQSRKESLKLQHLNACLITMFFTSLLLVCVSLAVIASRTYLSIAFLLAASLFLYPSNWTFLTVMFPIQHYGKLLGITQAVAGVITVLQFFLFRAALVIDPTFKYVNIVFFVLSCLTFVHPCWLLFKKHQARKCEEEREIFL